MHAIRRETADQERGSYYDIISYVSFEDAASSLPLPRPREQQRTRRSTRTHTSWACIHTPGAVPSVRCTHLTGRTHEYGCAEKFIASGFNDN